MAGDIFVKMGESVTASTWDSQNSTSQQRWSWTSLMIEVMVVSTVTWLSAMLPKVEAIRFCISLANMDWSDHRCLRNTTPSRLPHLPSHLNSFILHLATSLSISLYMFYMQNHEIRQNLYVFHWFITIRPSDCSPTLTWLPSKSQKLHQCLSQAWVERPLKRVLDTSFWHLGLDSAWKTTGSSLRCLWKTSRCISSSSVGWTSTDSPGISCHQIDAGKFCCCCLSLNSFHYCQSLVLKINIQYHHPVPI